MDSGELDNIEKKNKNKKKKKQVFQHRYNVKQTTFNNAYTLLNTDVGNS